MSRSARRDRSRPSAERPRLVTPTFLLITFATFAYFVSIGTLIPTLPLYVKGPLSGDAASVGLAIGSFSLTAVLLRPWVGSLGDRRGRRLLMIVGALLVGASVAAYIFVASLGWLIVLRLLTGAGEAFFYVGAASGINDLAPDERRGEALSFFSLALYSGIAAGPVLGESVLDAVGFHWVWIASALSAFVAMAVALLVPETRNRIELESLREKGVGVGLESTREARDGVALDSLLERDDLEPVPARKPRMRLVHPAGLRPGFVLLTSVWGLAGFNAFVPLYARELGMSGSRVVFVTYSVIVLVIRSAGAQIPDRLGSGRTARTALALSAVGLSVMAAWEAVSGLFVGAAIFALGQALAFPALMSIAVRGAPARERGSVVGTFTAFFDLAFGVGAVSLGLVADAVGFPGAFATAAVIAAGGLVLLFGLGAAARRAEAAAEAGATSPPERAEIETGA